LSSGKILKKETYLFTMSEKRIYIDTSVVGGCFDAEFLEDSQQLFDNAVLRNDIKILVSNVLLFELEEAPLKVKNYLSTLPARILEYIALNEESLFLANAYLEEGIGSEKSVSDARRVAIATVQHASVLASWNFKHIVNVERIHLYNAVNLKLGYPMIEIRSPKEIIYEN